MLLPGLENVRLSKKVKDALSQNLPIVALESAVITHGLSFPENRNLALDMERVVHESGCVPATIGVIKGQVVVGLNENEIEFLSTQPDLKKIGNRLLAAAIIKGWSGGTTVSGTLVAAYACGIKVFVTGGIGGIHRDQFWDVSADLPQLAQTPMVVVCAGAKSILDLPATVEYLETWGIPVLGYQTDTFPAFFSRDSGLKSLTRVETPEEISRISLSHWSLGLRSAILAVIPPPEETALPFAEIDKDIAQAVVDAEAHKISGQEVTPYLLKRVAELSQGESVKANLALLKNNAQVGSEIAKSLNQMS
jgi:pseudouridine-5'-phosphate glycosidase